MNRFDRSWLAPPVADTAGWPIAKTILFIMAAAVQVTPHQLSRVGLVLLTWGLVIASGGNWCRAGTSTCASLKRSLGMALNTTTIPKGFAFEAATGLDRQRLPSAKPKYVPGEVIVKLKDGRTDGIIHNYQADSARRQSRDATLIRLQSDYELHNQCPVFEGVHRQLDSRSWPPLKLAGIEYRASSIEGDWLRFYLLKTERDVLTICAELNDDPEVEYAQPNYIYEPYAEPNDPSFADQYAHQLTQMPLAWDITTGSPNVVVAVPGTGVYIEHPDLKENIWVNEDEIPGNGKDDDGNGFVDDRHGWDFDDDDGDIRPAGFYGAWGHETAVAGVIAAVGNNGEGVCGVNWRCSIMPLRLSSPFTSAKVAAAIEYATANGARVVNMSFGGDELGPEDDLTVKETVDNAFAQGVLLVAAAGNDNKDMLGYPAAYYNVMAVAATGGDDTRARWGRYGGTSFGPWVDIAAPGTDIFTLEFEEGYGLYNGTSLSAPYVAGLAALLFSHRPELTNIQARAILESTTDSINYGLLDPNICYLGTGRVNAYQALQGVSVQYPLAEIVEPTHRDEFAQDVNEIPLVLFVHGDFYYLEQQLYGQDVWTLVAEGVVNLDSQDGLLHTSLANTGVGTFTLRLSVLADGHVHTDEKVFGIAPGRQQESFSRAVPELDPFEDPLFGFFESFESSPICMDIDGDGRNELIQSSSSLSWFGGEGQTHIWTEDGNSLPGWPQEIYGPPSNSTSAVGDIDGDGDFEVITTTSWGYIHVWHWQNGQPVSGDWPKLLGEGGYLGAEIAQPIVLADMDGDGDSEILVLLDASYEQETAGIYALQGDGTELWHRRYEALGPLSVADLDRDGDIEIVCCAYAPATSNPHTYVFDNQGQRLEQWEGGSDKGTVIADLDADGELEIVFCTNDSVRAVHLDGSILWQSQIQEDFDVPGVPQMPSFAFGESPGMISVADINNDGYCEVYINSEIDIDGLKFSQIHAFDHQGNLLTEAGFPKKVLGRSLNSVPLIGDIDGDGEKELLVAAAGETLMAWNSDGTVTPGFPWLSMAAEYYTTPALADLDQDGDVEIMFAGFDFDFHVMDLPGQYDPNKIDWGMFRRDPQCSGLVLKPPKLNPVSVSAEIKPGDRLQLQLSASNPDDLPLQFYVGHTPEGARFDSETNTFLWKPVTNQVFQTHTFYLFVTDGIRQDSQPISVTVIPDAIYHTNMDTNPGWQLDSGWAWGTPTGQGSENGDPNSGHTGQYVIGYELDGDYNDSMNEIRYATTGAINCEGYKNITLSFWRWLGIESPYDRANIQVSNDGTNWVQLWTTGYSHISDESWQFVELSVPTSVAGDSATGGMLYFRWGIGPTDESVTYPGWNIDDVQVTGERIQ
ncbi:MAG: S8 family serine peptidase [Sedimentisphaerales bacterium]